LRWQPILFVLLGACSGAADDSINITHDVCAPIAVSSATPTDIQSRGIDDALAMWRTHGVADIARYSADRPDHAAAAPPRSIDIQFQAAATASRGLYDDETGVVYINELIADPEVMRIVIAHELGHAFGLPHITDRPSLMNPSNITVDITPEDQTALEAIWGACTR
jgi:hypothetical protein